MCKKAGYSSFFVLIYLEYSSKHRANASKPCQRSVCGFFPRVCEQIAESDRMTPCRGWGSALRTNRTQVRHVFPLLSVPCRRVSCTTPQQVLSADCWGSSSMRDNRRSARHGLLPIQTLPSPCCTYYRDCSSHCCAVMPRS